MADRWVTVSDAARHFGVTERTIYRRIQSGKLTARTDGSQTLVMVETDDIDPASDDDSRASQAEIALLQELLQEARNERDYLRQALAAALSKIPQIEARSDVESSPDQPQRRPWWWPWKRG